eukprot:GFUD01006338.1.p1 GENE.GFUD01006338.1~~GFUD01006338.1.p1  ORF type:complete len:238 (-),score=62.11 GFUD01006338.1:74-787(-)
MSSGDIITLNVGGRLFTTTRMTLLSESDSVLGRMFDLSSPIPPAKLVDGAYFIDANPEVFEVILDFLRYKTVIIPTKVPVEAVLVQARYFGLDNLIFQVSERKSVQKVKVNAGGTIFETSKRTLTQQPDSALAKMVVNGESEIFLDVCPKAFEILLNFLRSGARKIPPNTNVCTESIGSAAQMLGVDICLQSKKGPGYCKIVWSDDRRDKSRFCNCKMLGLRNHKNAPTTDDWMLDD